MILNPPICELKDFNNLFIELTAKNCNQRCKHCYIDFPLNKNVKDFIPIDIIKKAIEDTKSENIECIYLTGAEPMTHPDFNNILRLCLRRSNVCIFTNGTFINEKKARFLKRVEDETNHEIIFKLSIDHYDEIKNDEIRSRGSYRIVINAIKHLNKYGFNPILCITNYYNEPESVLIEEFMNICNEIGYKAEKHNIIINNFCPNNNIEEFDCNNKPDTDCEYGRMLTAKGVYSCPFLANDYRGRCGSDLTDYSKHNSLETTFCSACLHNKHIYFGINFDAFKF